MYSNGGKIYQFKANNSETKLYSLCLGKISRDYTVDNKKKTGLNGYVFDFSVDWNTIGVTVIWNVQNYLISYIK